MMSMIIEIFSYVNIEDGNYPEFIQEKIADYLYYGGSTFELNKITGITTQVLNRMRRNKYSGAADIGLSDGEKAFMQNGKSKNFIPDARTIGYGVKTYINGKCNTAELAKALLCSESVAARHVKMFEDYVDFMMQLPRGSKVSIRTIKTYTIEDVETLQTQILQNERRVDAMAERLKKNHLSK